MERLILGIPALMLLGTGVISSVGSIVLAVLTRATNGPPHADLSMELLVVTAAGVVFGLVAIWVGWGVWRSKIWLTRAAMLLSVTVLAFLAKVLPEGRMVFGYHAAGPSYPRDDGRVGPIAVLIVLYLVSLACLLIAERRLAASSVPEAP